MTRILCIRFPNWPLQRLVNARPMLRRRAVAVYEEQRGCRVVASNQPGVVPGTPVAEVTGLHLERHDPLADYCTLQRVALWCEQFSPIVGLENSERPTSLFLDLTGLAPLFSNEQALAERIVRAFARRGLMICLAIADTLGAAWAATHGGEAIQLVERGNIEPLLNRPAATLRLPAKTVQVLEELGIQQVGQLLNLPRAGLAARFGQELIDRLDQFTGAKPEPIAAYRALPEIVCERQFEFPIERRATLEAALAEMVEQVSKELTLRQQGAVQLECRLVCQRSELSLLIGLFEASNDSRHLWNLLRMRLEQCVLASPVASVCVAVVLSARLVYRQRELFAADHNGERELALLIDRLSSRLGREAVLRASLVSDAQPEYAYRYEPLAGSIKRRLTAEHRKLPERPPLVESHPIPLEVLSVAPSGPPMRFRWQGQQHRTRRSWGPERIQTGWWRGRYIRRDYYRIEDDRGRQFWLFRSGGKWFLHGIFD